MATHHELRLSEFDARQRVRELRRAVFDDRQTDATDALVAAERQLQEISTLRASAETKEGADDGVVVSAAASSTLLGPDTTRIDAQVDLRMSSVPTSIVHLFDARERPLVSYRLRNADDKQTKRLRIITFIEGYTARAIDTVELKALDSVTVLQLPTFFPDRVSTITEVTRAMVTVEVEDLDARTELQRTVPVWLLARTTAPLQVKDPSSGTWTDLTPYLGAYVTPNAPSIMSYLRTAAQKHPKQRLVGYQVGEGEVVTQVQAVYEALAETGIKYINSTIDFTPEGATANNQRVRLPRESLADRSANCIDGTVLVASLLEAISLNPAIVIIPGHAFVAWETWRQSGKWRYLETTMMSTNPFAEACQSGDQTAAKWIAEDAKDMFKLRALRDLRAQQILPLE